jgi:hypothetical protein
MKWIESQLTSDMLVSSSISSTSSSSSVEKPTKVPALPPKSSLQKRAVSFDENELQVIVEFTKYTEEEAKDCFMSGENWKAVGLDIELTRKRWENHVQGHIAFDTINNTTRGLERHILDYKLVAHIHHRDVFAEVNRQKENHHHNTGNQESCCWQVANLNWDDVRRASLIVSEDDLERALERARQDEDEAILTWEATNSTEQEPTTVKEDRKRRGSAFSKIRSSLVSFRKRGAESSSGNGKLSTSAYTKPY